MKANLADLHPGTAINSRVTDASEGIESLANSIAEHGLILPIAVRSVKRGKKRVLEIVDGHRRFTALKMLVEQGRLPADAEVDVSVNDADDTLARERSLAANIERLPLHPIDQYEAFAGIAAAGRSEEDIARRFAISQRQVKQVLALGRLHEGIRQAWREGEIREDVARAFTLAEPHAQWDVYESLRKQRYGLSSWDVKKAFTKEADLKAFGFVGEDDYVAAGGTLKRDLFTDQVYLDNPELVGTLFEEKKKALCAELVEHGYAFAWWTDDPRVQQLRAHGEDMEDVFWPEETETVEDDDEVESVFDPLDWARTGYDPVRREHVGLVIGLDYQGRITVDPYSADLDTGEGEPVEAADLPSPEEEEAEAEKAADLAAISQALKHEVIEWRTRAYRNAYAQSPVALLQMAIAGAGSSNYCGAFFPARAVGGRMDRADQQTWQDVVIRLRCERAEGVLSDALMLQAFARRYAAGIDTDGLCDEDLLILATGVDRKMLRAELLAAFDAEQYFARVPLRNIQAFCDEMAVDPVINASRTLVVGRLPLIKTTKVDAQNWAIRKAKEHGWLPPLMRISDIGAFPESEPAHLEAAE